MRRIPLVAALALLFVIGFAYVFTREVRASDPCFSSCAVAANYIAQRGGDCDALPGTHTFNSSCTMDSGGTPNGGYGYSCAPVCYGPCPPGTSGFGGGGEIHDYCTP